MTNQIQEIILNLSVKQKIAQLLMLDFRYWGLDEKGDKKEFTQINPEVADIFKNYGLGSIILFRENTKNANQTLNLTQDLQQASDIPLLIGIDQEGGIVTRLQDGTDMPGNMALGAGDDTQTTQQVAECIAKELNAVGINLNFAPCVDVNSNQLNPVIGLRSFSSDANLVSKHANAYIRGLEKNNIIANIKHFPGHGNTSIDTHLDLATVNYSKDEIEDIDLKPYADIIKNGVDTIMSAHVTIPALDSSKIITKNGDKITVPTTFSKEILTNILRKQLGFDGVLISDALEMKAISDRFTPEQMIINSILAGIDIPAMAINMHSQNDVKTLDLLLNNLKLEYNSNTTFKNRIEESLARVLKLKNKYNLISKLENLSDKEIHKQIKNIGTQESQEIEKQASAKAITLLKNDGTLPFEIEKKNKQRISILDASESRMFSSLKELQKIKDEIKSSIILHYHKIGYSTEIDDVLKQIILSSDLTIIQTYNLQKDDSLPENITQFANKNNKQLVVLATRNPYDIARIPSCKNYLAIYGATDFDQTNYQQTVFDVNLKTAMRTIFISQKHHNLFNAPTGKLPIDIKNYNTNEVIYQLGYSLDYSK